MKVANEDPQCYLMTDLFTPFCRKGSQINTPVRKWREDLISFFFFFFFFFKFNVYSQLSLLYQGAEGEKYPRAVSGCKLNGWMDEGRKEGLRHNEGVWMNKTTAERTECCTALDEHDKRSAYIDLTKRKVEACAKVQSANYSATWKLQQCNSYRFFA